MTAMNHDYVCNSYYIGEMFFEHIARSLNHDLPKSYSEFTYARLIQQGEYFSKLDYPSKLVKKYVFILLKRIYLWIIQNNETEFTEENGLPLILIDHKFFFHHIGCRQVIADPKKAIPEFDNWAVLCGSYSNSAAEISHTNDFVFVDFSGLNDKMKYLCKAWFWYSSISNPNKKQFSIYIIAFCKFYQEQKVVSFQKEKDMFTYQVMQAFLHKQNVKVATLALRHFFHFLQISKLYKVDKYIVSNMPTLPFQKGKNCSSPISRSELKPLLSHLHNLSKSSEEPLRVRLLFYIVQMLLLTEIRASSLLSMTLDDIKMHEGKCLLLYAAKTSKGRKTWHYHDEYIYSLFIKVKELTAPVRPFIHPRVNNFVFVDEKGIFSEGRCRINLYKACRDSLDKKYSSQNFRDTHMTQVYQEAGKEGINDLLIGNITGHKYWKTPFEHYIAFDKGDTFSTINSTSELLPPT